MRAHTLVNETRAMIDVRVRPEGAIYGVSPHIAQSIVTVDYEGPRGQRCITK